MSHCCPTNRMCATVPVRIATGVFAAVLVASSSAASPQAEFRADVVSFLENHCVACHAGDEAEAGLEFDRFADGPNVQDSIDLWEKVARVVGDRQMPPADETQPADEPRERFLRAVESVISSYDCSLAARPGRVTIRRLNKVEYNNTIRDLTGLDLSPSEDFPSDDVGEGFDNIGDVLTISPVLLERYLNAAEQVAEAVVADSAARERIFPLKGDENSADRAEAARQNIRRFAERAWRRPLSNEDAQRLFSVMASAWFQDASVEQIAANSIATVLSSPHFIFRVEGVTPRNAAEDVVAGSNDPDAVVYPLTDHELAVRLSYFLWSTMPDDRLRQLADEGQLSRPEVLREETLRMLGDPRAEALTQNFAGQWLQLRDVAAVNPDPDRFPQFDDELRQAMRRETELLFSTIRQEDLSILTFLTADFTFVNERLARHYGISDVAGGEFRRTDAPQGRRGVLSHAGILMLTSNPTRTSPVKRGKWILENLLGTPPPPPPPDVPELSAEGDTLGSLREQMELHRTNPSCAVCHTTMDTLGFGLENFDAVGNWRDRDGQFDIDPSGVLPGGNEFQSAADMVRILADEKKTDFCRCLIRRMLTYALGRGLQSFDRCVVNETLARMEAEDYRFSTLVTSITTSPAFTHFEASPRP